MAAITLDHVRQAAEWARDAGAEPKPIDGKVRIYEQSQWDCGTSCCIWGAASLIAGAGPVTGPPPDEWRTDAMHTAAYGLLCSGTSTPQMVLDLLSGTNLRGANLRGAKLSGANLRGADLSGANLRSANLRSANLRGAKLSGADLSVTDLNGADLSGADLNGANLRGAKLSGADLSGAELRGAVIWLGNRCALIQ